MSCWILIREELPEDIINGATPPQLLSENLREYFSGKSYLWSFFLKKISDMEQNRAVSPPHQIRERIRLFMSKEVPRKALRMDSIMGVMGW